MRKLATVRQISEIRPIAKADQLELAIIEGWQAVVKKGEYKPEDLVVYCEIDSFLPVKPEYEFLRKSCYRKMADGTEGFRIKTMKLRGELSQGLVLPNEGYELGQDVTKELGITKYEATLPTDKSGSGLGRNNFKARFPSFIPKTDEERIQNLKSQLAQFQERTWCVTEKLDGTSFTFTAWEEVRVCSRNWELHEDESSVYWQIANRYNLPLRLKIYPVAIQGEIVGPGIQGNKYKLEEPELYVFNVYDIVSHEYMEQWEAKTWCQVWGLKFVPMLQWNYELPNSIEEILAYAEGKSELEPSTEREGVVFSTDDGGQRISFKAISNKFLLKED